MHVNHANNCLLSTSRRYLAVTDYAGLVTPFAYPRDLASDIAILFVGWLGFAVGDCLHRC